MKIKRTSWHYKISTFWADSGREEKWDDNLCRYFWGVVGVLFVSFLYLCFFGILIRAVGFIIHDYFTSPFFISITIMIAFILSSMIFPILAIYYLREKIGKPLEIPKANLLFEYLKAKKEKVCPLIEYHD